MSASREKKARQEQLTNGYVDPKAKRAQEEKAMQRRSSILYISVAVAFVIVAIIVVIANSKVIQRNADAVTMAAKPIPPPMWITIITRSTTASSVGIPAT